MPMLLWTCGVPGLAILRGSTAANASSYSFTSRRPSSALRGGERWRERRCSVSAVMHGVVGVYGPLPLFTASQLGEESAFLTRWGFKRVPLACRSPSDCGTEEDGDIVRMDCAGGERALRMGSCCWLDTPSRGLRLWKRRPVRLRAVGRGADDGEGEESLAGRPAQHQHHHQHVVWSAGQRQWGRDRDAVGDSPGSSVPAEANDSQPDIVQCTTEQHATAGWSQVRAAPPTRLSLRALSA
jgi:hypothetical protein